MLRYLDAARSLPEEPAPLSKGSICDCLTQNKSDDDAETFKQIEFCAYDAGSSFLRRDDTGRWWSRTACRRLPASCV